MKNTLLLLVTLLAMRSCIFGQDTLSCHCPRDSAIKFIYVPAYRSVALVYVGPNGEPLTHREIVDRLLLYEAPAAEVQSYRGCKAGAIVCGVLSVVAAAFAGAERGQGNYGAEGALGGVMGGLLIGVFVCGGESARHWNRAIKLYNKRFMQ